MVRAGYWTPHRSRSISVSGSTLLIWSASGRPTSKKDDDSAWEQSLDAD